MKNDIGTAARIVALAQEVMQVSGYAGLHYGTLAENLGITRAAVHHHFPNKVDLARRVIAEYIEWTRGQFAAIDATGAPVHDKMLAYFALYRLIIEDGDERLCPGGMLAAEAMTLPPELKADVREFFDLHITWVAKVLLGDGSRTEPEGEAARVVAALQGALLVSRLYGRPESFDAIVDGLMAIVPTTPPGATARPARKAAAARTGTVEGP
ncbi:TetR/AcrR family transcriptional regulator [Amycolatopsis rhabdoformis]|uniref:TetR/AcrR family transcriptional regulator n=1 Tax=Amycolatopsis rhabdoformis TaxID=1448059 RepID=A0ABZ1IKM6_9PSEU|nr:TetR/AcrR family transcriptional regulator [Amycolatopsis rhabdoformis]WSE34749.1 TetR/AcrR family transcriptional regulator [Amycolatopsis rhabdoformis]